MIKKAKDIYPAPTQMKGSISKHLKVLAICAAEVSFSSSYAEGVHLSEDRNRTNQSKAVEIKGPQSEKELAFSSDEGFLRG